uniref:HEPN domain-containing protein n=1 Tax=Desulfovibrio sp. U5L TaxID=596152 RepID=I2Q565_9BACT
MNFYFCRLPPYTIRANVSTVSSCRPHSRQRRMRTFSFPSARVSMTPILPPQFEEVYISQITAASSLFQASSPLLNQRPHFLAQNQRNGYFSKMAHELEKIEEAKFFLSKLREAIAADKLHEVKYYASAFSSAACSAYEYANKDYKEKKRKPTNDLFYLFNNFRNTNIHERPAPFSKNCTVLAGSFCLNKSSGEVSYTEPDIKNTSRYYIEDWQGEEDLESLCVICLEKLENFLKEKNKIPPPR